MRFNIGNAVRRFLEDRRGHFGFMMAIAVVPLVMAGGLAIDVARVIDYKSRLANAADAATLAAIAEGSRGREHAFFQEGVGPIPVGEEDARSVFEANFLADDTVRLTNITADVRRTDKGLYSRIAYEAEIATTFGGVFSLAYFPVKGQAESEVRADASVDFYLLLDNTPSMGVAATPQDIKTMVNNTPDKCAFACHSLNDADNYYNLAKKLGVSMRIDVVRKAAQELTETAKLTRSHSGQFRMAVYTFGAAATNLKLTQVAALSSNMNKVKVATGAVDLMTIPHQNYDNDQQTDFDKALTDINKAIPNPGSGLGGQPPRKVLFFVSDGVGDSYKPTACTKKTTGGRCQEPIDVRYCQAIKDRGISIAVLYTTYLPLPTNGWYNTWIKPFHPEIAERMKECASPGLFFEVSPSEGISDAMKALFLKTIAVLRLIS